MPWVKEERFISTCLTSKMSNYSLLDCNLQHCSIAVLIDRNPVTVLGLAENETDLFRRIIRNVALDHSGPLLLTAKKTDMLNRQNIHVTISKSREEVVCKPNSFYTNSSTRFAEAWLINLVSMALAIFNATLKTGALLMVCSTTNLYEEKA